MSPTYAKGTSVPVRNSRIEIETLLEKWKASRIAVAYEAERAIVLFSIGRWSVRFTMPLPNAKEAKAECDAKAGWRGSSSAQQAKWLEQRTREKWRALALTIKAKLVSVENGVETFEEAFLAHLVLDGGATVSESVLPRLRAGDGPLALPPGPSEARP